MLFNAVCFLFILIKKCNIKKQKITDLLKQCPEKKNTFVSILF